MTLPTKTLEDQRLSTVIRKNVVMPKASRPGGCARIGAASQQGDAAALGHARGNLKAMPGLHGIRCTI
jgi:hypothetical protein